ncbi:ricin-type beta-trefoil lectin domain protein [Streptomyces flavotricini]|uniref:Ricin-type beta-trefoil lectin domain protein n=1 Tax=Streptomyces flavotricini TaxID=66888 RepID=A0ABS8EFB4_9ACTN|nr:ricin-type beta-trefoil lectin domain protein [Streptomyces flavotricini]MCC0099845.1 ricin-type beta-trefoil lectin domain protein [Streptomyces flavotricini]
MSAKDFALAKAKETGQPYELMSARTESSDTWALPTGKWSVNRHGTTVRILRAGVWLPTDATLQFAPDGRVTPKASAVSVTFSGGGTGALLTGVRDGRTLSLTWPRALPKPTLAGNVATYANVLPDVDLQLKAEVEGFSQLLVVKTAAAAQHPDLATLKFKLDTVGLNVSTDATTGLINAVNPAGQSVFTASTPMMWDSTTTPGGTSGGSTPLLKSKTAAPSMLAAATGDTQPAPADAFVPPSGAKDAQMPTTVSGGNLEIKPDQALLTSAATKYPVFIDPSVAWGERQNWAWAYRSWPNNSYWNTKQDVRVGYESETNGLSRSFFQLDTANLKGAQVTKSTFRVKETWSWSCTATPVELWSTGAISPKTTWNNQPGKGRKLDTVTAAKGRAECGAGNLEFNATDLAKESASKGWSSITLGLYAPNEGDQYQWKRFDPKTITLETEYNNPPDTPSALGTSPSTSCANGGAIGNTRVGLYATFSDRDAGNLNAEYQVFKAGQSTPVATQTLPANNGKVTTWSIPDASLPSGDYTWQVRAKDGDGATSVWSPSCKFSVDRNRPSKPPVISSTQFPDGRNGWPATTGKARTPGTFTFSANGVTDVKEIIYSTDFEPWNRPVPASGSVTIAPSGSGPHYIYAYSVDKAGNRSDTTSYLYYATRSQTVDGPKDLNGDGNRDIWTVDSRGTLLMYAGQGNGKFAPAADGGVSFGGAQIDTFGDWDGDGYNDLVALQQPSGMNTKKLWAYSNNGQGTAVNNPVELTVACPVKDPTTGCDYGDDWNGDDHWYNAEQIIAPGDLNGDGVPDLLVKQGKQLWAYYTSIFGTLDSNGQPVLVGNGDWDKFTVAAPGDLNGDGIPDLWLRDNATGDLLRTYGSKGSDGNVDPTTWGNAAGRVKIASGLEQAAFPAIGTSGDVTGDKLADLWAVSANRQLATLAGTGTAQPLNVTGISQTPAFLGNLSAPAAQWKLTGQSGGITPSAVGDYPATTSGVTWPTATIGGRSTAYAAFGGGQATMTTGKSVIDTRKSFTISTWAKVSGTGALVLSQDNTRNSAFTLYADPATKQWRFALAKGDVDGWAYDWSDAGVNDSAAFVPDAWTQLTAVYNADTALMSLYVNGALGATGHHVASTSPAPSGSLVSGRYKVNGAPDYFGGFTGGISNLAVYPYAATLTAPGATGPMSLAAKPSHCLDNDNGRTTDGNRIQAWDCNMINGGEAQKFEIRADGTIRVAGKCIDAAYAGTTNGTLIWLYPCNGSYGQQFLPHADGTIYHPKSGRCLDTSNMNTGTQLYLWDCNATNPQRWTIPALSTAPLPVPLP